jgi:hypothetical protein
MGGTRLHRGRPTQGDNPNWTPLLDAVGEEVTADFMWMYEVELNNGVLLQAYKHIDTRRYAHLAADGTAFVFESPGRYRCFPAADLFAAVFASLPRLSLVGEAQIRASRCAVERLRRR